MMKSLTKVSLILSLLSTLVSAIATPTQAQPSTAILSQPNALFNVTRESGKCPDTVGIWNIYNQDDTTAVRTVIADTLFIGGEVGGFAKLISSNSKYAEFEAPLPSTYASCTGKTNSETYPEYEFQFKNGKIYFIVDLNKIFTSDVFTKKIVYVSPTVGRPYVIWLLQE